MSSESECARATIVGRLESHVRPVGFADRSDERIAQVHLLVGTVQIPVTVRNEQLDALANVLPNSLVRVECSMVLHAWKVAGQSADRIELVADSAEVLKRKVPVHDRIAP